MHIPPKRYLTFKILMAFAEFGPMTYEDALQIHGYGTGRESRAKIRRYYMEHVEKGNLLESNGIYCLTKEAMSYLKRLLPGYVEEEKEEPQIADKREYNVFKGDIGAKYGKYLRDCLNPRR